MEAHMVWYCQSMKCGEPPVTMERTETAVSAKDDTITGRDSAEMTTTIENYCVKDTTGKTAPSEESWYTDCASTSYVWGDRRKFSQYM